MKGIADMADLNGTINADILGPIQGATDGSDHISGDAGDDWLKGVGGADWLQGGAGADVLDGGEGFDMADYRDSSSGIVIGLTEAPGYGGTAQGDILISIERVDASYYSDFLIGNDGINLFSGRSGDDTLKGGGGHDYLYGDADNDTLIGGADGDTLDGGAGIDTASYALSAAGVTVHLEYGTASSGDAQGDQLYSIENLEGSAYYDDLMGDGGANVLTGNDGDDTLDGAGGIDTLYGGGGGDTLFGRAGNDTLYGGADGDYLEGGGDNDVLYGGAGPNLMIGGVGNDTYYVESSGDVIIDYAGQGSDVVQALVDYTLGVNVSVEIISLDSGTATSATGNNLGQTIFGNSGNNYLNGGGGADILSGLGGNDIFVFNAGEAHGDLVYEFQGNGAFLGDQMMFVGYGPGATFTHLGGEFWQISGVVQETIQMAGGASFDASDLLFV
jgi:Ca2+-binding RTX toxin-like protein